MRNHTLSFAVILLAAGCVEDLTSSQSQSISLSGAIFTTTSDGSFVDKNIYAAKEDVYLDGGPRNPQDAALPEGIYVFQVTDPPGKVLLSTDDASCRQFHIDVNGRIDLVLGGACAHATSLDTTHGGLTVQLMPYADTPNNGNEYKVWVTPLDSFIQNGGFINDSTKTDNFKFKVGPCPLTSG